MILLTVDNMRMISNIVFTKNRPLQLHAYLESLHRFFSAQMIQTYILYKPELFSEEYELCFCAFPDCTVIRETEFHTDFLSLLSGIDTKYILFGIDDVVYFDGVDFGLIDKVFNECSEDIFGFSLRFGKSMVDSIGQVEIDGQTVYKLDWTNGKTPSTRYPYELCATIYKTDLVKEIIYSAMDDNPLMKKIFSPGSFLMRFLGRLMSVRSLLKSFGYFYNPNTLESWNCRWCQNYSYRLPKFLYFQKNCASAIQVNMVNTSTVNLTDGTAQHTVEVLAERYRQGCRLDIDYIAQNKPLCTHSGPEYFKLIHNETVCRV